MEFINIFLLSAIEGFTEFLPVSSTAHLIVLASFLGIEEGAFRDSFTIAVQFGTILSVLFLYWKMFLNIETLKKLVIAFLPTGIAGFLFYSIIKNVLLSSTTLIIWTLFLGGIFLVVFEYVYRTHEKEELEMSVESISYSQSFIVGLFQAIALIPGVSRSASTIVGGLFAGISRITIATFSFLLAVPTMAAATIFDLYKNAEAFTAGEIEALALGFVLSFAFGVLSIKFLLAFLNRFTFVPFGVYRIIVAVLLGIIFFV